MISRARKPIAALLALLGAAALTGALLARRAPPPRAPLPPDPAPGRQQSCDGRGPGAGMSCGPQGDADCCASLPLPAGSFLRGHDGAGCRDREHPATLSAFALDTYEVTVGRFRAFVQAGKGTQRDPPARGEGAHPRLPGSGWDPAWNAALAPSVAALHEALACHAPFGVWTAAPGADEALPINCVTWFEAFAFCAWDGGRLPTDAERGYAASGGDEQRLFPWSDPPAQAEIDATRAVFGARKVEAVGSRPRGAGRWGHADLAGNVWEWTLDAATGDHLLPSVGAALCGAEGYPSPCVDCAALGPAPKRVLRGGGFGMPGPAMIASIRRADPPDARQSVFGLRCARAVAAAPPARSGAAALDAPAATQVDGGPCVPRCEGRQCGPDGCGGACGACEGATSCDGAARCVAYPPGPYRFVEGGLMPNQAFRGFERPAADRSIHTLTLADLHDPTGGASFPPGSSWGGGKPRPKALLLDFAAGWSEVSRADVGEILPALAEPYARRGGMFVLVMLEGERRGQAADVPNLFAWMDRHRIAYPAVVDPSLDVARFVDPAPCKVIVDPRTMRIVKIATGRETPGSAFWQAFDALLTR